MLRLWRPWPLPQPLTPVLVLLQTPQQPDQSPWMVWSRVALRMSVPLKPP